MIEGPIRGCMSTEEVVQYPLIHANIGKLYLNFAK